MPPNNNLSNPLWFSLRECAKRFEKCPINAERRCEVVAWRRRQLGSDPFKRRDKLAASAVQEELYDVTMYYLGGFHTWRPNRREEGSRNTPNLLTNSKDFADKEGDKRSQNLMDVTYGSPLLQWRSLRPRKRNSGPGTDWMQWLCCGQTRDHEIRYKECNCLLEIFILYYPQYKQKIAPPLTHADCFLWDG